MEDPDLEPEALLLDEPELAVFEDVAVVWVESVCEADCEDEPEPMLIIKSQHLAKSCRELWKVSD